MCPAVMGKVRCPLREESMSLSNERPEVLSPPDSPPPCCCHKTITVGPQVHAKTAQKHDYPSKEHRRQDARRTAVERTFSTVKDPASNDVSRGWCRLTGIAPVTLMLACVLVVRNDRAIRAFEERQADDAAGSRTGSRRRHASAGERPLATCWPRRRTPHPPPARSTRAGDPEARTRLIAPSAPSIQQPGRKPRLRYTHM